MDIFDLKNLWTFLTKKIYLRDILCKARNMLFIKKNGLEISLVEISNPFSIIYYRCGLALIFFCEGV